MSAKYCCIFGAGEYYNDDYSFSDGDYIIAADGGYMHLFEHNITPDILIGDFDSMHKPDFPNILEFSSHKDDTDYLIAIKHGLEKGYTRFKLYGGTGGRLDHTLANIQSLAYLAKHGAVGHLYGNSYILTAVSNGSVCFDADCRGIISVFSLTDYSYGVDLKGLEYELCDHTLSNSYPLGVSNKFTGEPSTVSVREGTLLIYIEKQDIKA